MNKKAVIYYEVIMLFTVLIALPVLVWRLEKVTAMKEVFLGEGQIAILDLPYEKENIIHFVQTAAELEMPDILKEVAAENGYSTEPPGGLYIDVCPIINTGVELKKVNRPDVLEALTNAFNAHIDKYISDYNAQPDVAKIQLNNYELFIKDDDINAIALMPVAQTVKTDRGTITAWFAPSFTINYKHGLQEYKKIFDVLGTIAENCAKNAKPIDCANTYAASIPGWKLTEETGAIHFAISTPNGNLCYVMKTA